MKRPSRLTLQLYAASLVQLLAVIGVTALVGWLSFRPHSPRHFVGQARYVTERLAQHLDQPAQLQREVARVRETLGVKVSIYREQRGLVASSVTPALAPLSAGRLETLKRSRRLFESHPPMVGLWLGQSDAYCLFVPAKPPRPPPAIWGFSAALVAAALTSIALTRSWTRPLRRLAQAARDFGRGDLSTRVALERNDEFGDVADAFDEMAQRITQLLQSQQALLANVSHELRTPIARIRVALDLASEGDPATAQQMLEGIGGDLSELERLMDDVFQMARLDLSGLRARDVLPLARKARFAPQDVLRGAAERFVRAHGMARLELQLPLVLPPASGDAALLRRALDNLLDNAAKYSSATSPVRLRAYVEENRVAILVEDDGIGIAEEDLKQVGTPFFRTDRSRARGTGGMGLGLSLARRIVEAHQGKLTIHSRPGSGTAVTIALPCAAPGEVG